MKTVVRGLLTCGLLTAAAGATWAQTPAQLVVDLPAGSAGLCPPCMGLWAMPVAPGADCAFVVKDPGVSPIEIVLPAHGHEAGLAYGTYKPSGTTPVTVWAVVDGKPSPPAGCIPPIHPAGDCPPGPWGRVVRVPPGLSLEVPILPDLPPIVDARLDRLATGAEARWVPVEARAQVVDPPDAHVTFDAEVGTGLYRVQLVDEAGVVRGVELVSVEDDRPPGDSSPTRRMR
jgi:hypothetical protein